MLIWNVIRDSALQFYEHLFRYVFLNIIAFVLFLPLLILSYSGVLSGWYPVLIIPIIVIGPLFLAGLYSARMVVEENELQIKYFFVNIKTHFKRGLLSFLYSLLVYGVLFVDLIFFLRRGNDNLWMLVLAIIIFYFLIIFSASQLYFWGLLVWREQLKLGEIIKQSFLLILDNIFFSLLWLLTVIIFVILIVITAVGIPILLMGVITLLIINGNKYILDKY